MEAHSWRQITKQASRRAAPAASRLARPVRHRGTVARAVAMLVLGATGGLAPAAAQSPAVGPSAQIVHAPWTKFCGRSDAGADICVTSAGAQLTIGGAQGQPLVDADVVGGEGSETSMLRVRLPALMPRRYGRHVTVRVAMDFSHIGEREVLCTTRGCVAHFPIDQKVMERLKIGRTLYVDVVDPPDPTMPLSLPLAGFATAQAGPPSAMKQFEATSPLKLFCANDSAACAWKRIPDGDSPHGR